MLDVAITLALLAQSDLSSQLDFPVQGRVVDASGKPAAGVELSTCWTFPDPMAPDKGAPEPAAWLRALETDEQGRFSGTIRGNTRRRTLLAMDAGRRQGGLAVVDTRGPQRDLVITLRKMVAVRGRFDVMAKGAPPDTVGAWFAKIPEFTAVSQCISRSGDFLTWLPPGEYQLMYSTADFQHIRANMMAQKVVLTGESPVVDLGVVPLMLPLVAHVTGTVAYGGEPMKDADVDMFWTSEGGQMKPMLGFSSGDDGGFAASFEIPDEAMVLPIMALDKERALGGVDIFDPKGVARVLRLNMHPLVRVRGQLVMKDSGKRPRMANASIEKMPEGVRLAQCLALDAAIDFQMPPGLYRLRVKGKGLEDYVTDLALTSSDPNVHLGDLPLDAAQEQILMPELPRFDLAAARDAAPDVQLSDYYGRWVVLFFWQYWDRTCTRDTIPKLMEAADRLEDLKDQFQVLAIHDSSAPDLELLEKKLALIRDGLWNGRHIPFPILLDKDGATWKAFEVERVPYFILISPRGRIHRGLGTDDLEAELRKDSQQDQ